ncbi:MAG: DNA polymerase I, partial [Candidatus Limnocylindrales bacterium]
FDMEGYEADDLIGSLTLQAQGEGIESVIVSGDLDMLQLVSEHTRLMFTRMGAGATIMYDPARIHERYGLAPHQMIDFKALKGDTTDNIPGLAGVGDKTAAKLLEDFGSLDGVFEHLDEVKPDKLRDKLGGARDDLMLWRELVTIDRHVPVSLDLEAARLGDYDRAEVIRLFREYEFRTLVERLPAVDGEAPMAPGDLLREADRGGPVPAAQVAGRVRSAGNDSGLQLSLDFGNVSTTRADTAEAPAAQRPIATELRTNGGDPVETLRGVLHDPAGVGVFAPGDDLAEWLGAQPELAVGAAFDDPRPRRGTLLGFAVTGADGRVVAVGTDGATALAERVIGTGVPLAGHDVKPLLVWELARRDPTASTSMSRERGTLPRVAFDTQVAAYILNAALRAQSLGDISAERLDLELPKAGELRGPELATVTSLAAAAVREPLARALVDEPGLHRILDELEMPLVPVLADMEATGVAIDTGGLGDLSRTFAEEIARLQEGIWESVGHQFTLGSPKQLEQVLFYELNLPRGKRTKTGFSTDASVLEELRPAHPMVGMLLDWRLYTKLKSTYLDALPVLLSPETGRLHTTFQQAVAATGRLSSIDPNLQNIPIRTELGRMIRRAFVSGDPDRVLMAADYSQIELRILAHVSGDVHLREAFERRADIHRETAARVLKKEPGAVTADERSMAKMVNFGLAYGMSDFGLASRAGIPRAEAQEFIASYFAAYSGISYYMLHIRETARQKGYVETLLGRRRWIPELEARNSALRGSGERMAINMPIQGTAADIMKIAMIRLHERLCREGSPARLLLSVHDEVVLEVPRSLVAELAPMVRETMESALALDVPLDVDVKVGDDWESMTVLSREAVPA